MDYYLNMIVDARRTIENLPENERMLLDLGYMDLLNSLEKKMKEAKECISILNNQGLNYETRLKILEKLLNVFNDSIKKIKEIRIIYRIISTILSYNKEGLFSIIESEKCKEGLIALLKKISSGKKIYKKSKGPRKVISLMVKAGILKEEGSYYTLNKNNLTYRSFLSSNLYEILSRFSEEQNRALNLLRRYTFTLLSSINQEKNKNIEVTLRSIKRNIQLLSEI